MLKSVSFKAVYRSDADNILNDFYVPALRQSSSYDRAVGFFSAAMLSYASQGLAVFLRNGGMVRLIFGGELDEGDVAALEEGYARRRLVQRAGAKILESIDDIADALATERLRALAWMVANGQLDLKLALKPKGMYHEKIGIFTDSSGDQVVFQGSANETASALLPDFNFESINVFPSWRPELRDHFLPYVDGFERLWTDKTKNTVVVDFPEAVRDRLIRIAKSSRQPNVELELEISRRLQTRSKPECDIELPSPKIPVTLGDDTFEIRAHQKRALAAWKARGLQGILAMATGAGKTLTAIYGMTRIFESTKRLFLVVAVPYQALADQWLDVLAEFKIRATPCYATKERWVQELSHNISLFDSGAMNFGAAVVVNRTLLSDEFQSQLRRIPGDSLAFIGDECHHHMASALNDALPKHARVRLGLSATPEHYHDPEQSLRLTQFYGAVAFTYSLEDALNDGVLTPYEYHVHLVDLTSDEVTEYHELSEKISRVSAGQSASEVEDSSDDTLKLLLFRRARLLANASEKLRVFTSILNHAPPSRFNLFYCGDGSVEEDDEHQPQRQVDSVSSILHKKNWKVAHFTARESRAERQRILDQFRIGMLDGLVAIRCLDEGVDVPECRTAYILASSRNPRQFIQRRGRILRQSPNKTMATIHDFVVRIPKTISSSNKLERDLLVNELKRVREFAALSSNRAATFSMLEETLSFYDLHHHFV